MTKDPRDAPTDVMRANGLISDLHNVTLLDESLSREQTIVAKMTRGLEMVPRMRKLGISASFLHRQLNQVASLQETTSQRNVNGSLKDIKTLSGKNRFATPRPRLGSPSVS